MLIWRGYESTGFNERQIAIIAKSLSSVNGELRRKIKQNQRRQSPVARWSVARIASLTTHNLGGVQLLACNGYIDFSLDSENQMNQSSYGSALVRAINRF